MKGIILAAGLGSRLFPITIATCKQLLPIFDKPMIYYPLSTLMLAGIRDILLISTKEDLPRFKKLLKRGHEFGINLEYAVQQKPEGIAQAFVIGKDFIGDDTVALALGDNLFYGDSLSKLLQKCALLKEGGMVFGYRVNDPERYGVVEFNKELEVIDIEEKPKKPKSNFVIPGMYFYDNSVVAIARSLKPSKRGEYEITDVNIAYLKERKLKVHLLGRGFAWLDTGTPDSFQKASSFVQAIQERQNIKIACLEEIAYRMGFICKNKFCKIATDYPQNDYGHYLRNLASFGF